MLLYVILSNIMSSNISFNVCFFGTCYTTTTVSVTTAYRNSPIIIDGLSGSRYEAGTIKTFPCGKMFCAHCFDWKLFNANNRVYSVRNGGELVYHGLVCQECIERVENGEGWVEGTRFADLCHKDWPWEIKYEINNRIAAKTIKKWQRFVQLRKERRILVRDVALVVSRKIEKCNVTPVLDAVVQQFNELHCLCN